jgi:hypothetical protein
MAVVIGALFQIILEFVCHGASRVVLPALTFGRVHVEPYAKGRRFSIWRQDGRIMVGEAYAILLGLTFWVVVGGIVIGLARSV